MYGKDGLVLAMQICDVMSRSFIPGFESGSSVGGAGRFHPLFSN